MNQTRRNNLFFIELMFSILFFIICAAVCTQLFVHAYLLNKETESTNQALLLSQSIAELFLGNRGDISSVKQTFSDYDCSARYLNDSSDVLLLFYNAETSDYVTDTSDADYVVWLNHHNDDSMSYADISVFYADDFPLNSESLDDAAIRKLTVQKYIGR